MLQKHDVQVGLVVYYQKGFFSTQAYMLVCAAKTYVLQKRYVLQKFVHMCCKNITSKSVSLLKPSETAFSQYKHQRCWYVLQKEVLQKMVCMCCKNMTYKSVSLLTIKWLFLHTKIHVGECYKNICAAKVSVPSLNITVF